MNTLSKYLKEKRLDLGLTLRKVEELTGISNAYISQVEHAKIIQPTPKILRKFSDCYELSYPRLLQMAGHPIISNSSSTVQFKTSSRLVDITLDEEKELTEYLSFLRRKRKK